MRAEHDVDERERRADALRHVRLLHHAAADGDEHRGIAALDVFQRADVAVDTVLSVLADRTGIEEDEIRLVFVVGKGKTHFSEHTLDFFAVRHVLLTAVGAHKSLRFRTHRAHLHDRGDIRGIQLLLLQLRRGHNFFIFQTILLLIQNQTYIVG